MLLQYAINEKNLNSEIETGNLADARLDERRLSMKRISILRLKQDSVILNKKEGFRPINEKNLNSEIET